MMVVINCRIYVHVCVSDWYILLDKMIADRSTGRCRQRPHTVSSRLSVAESEKQPAAAAAASAAGQCDSSCPHHSYRTTVRTVDMLGTASSICNLAAEEGGRDGGKEGWC